VKRLLSIAVLCCYVLQHFSCCCGTPYGLGGVWARAAVNVEQGERDLAENEPCEPALERDACCGHDHEHGDEAHDESESLAASSKRVPCCPKGHHVCAASHLIAINASRIAVDRADESCRWVTPETCVPAAALHRTAVLSDPGELLRSGPTLARLCVYVI